LVSAQFSRQNYAVLKQQQVSGIEATAYLPNGEIDSQFHIKQIVQPQQNRIIIYSRTAFENSVSIIDYKNDAPLKVTDSSTHLLTVTQYNYNDNGQLHFLQSVTTDIEAHTSSEEIHEWHYTSEKLPDYMFKIKNKQDTTLIKFTRDEEGNIVQEDWLKNNNIIETYYYYYNAKHQLTDIVRFNNKVKKLLPDYVLEYDEQARLIQTTQVPLNSSNYTVVQYVYNQNGLKTQENIYNKQKELIARIVYRYY